MASSADFRSAINSIFLPFQYQPHQLGPATHPPAAAEREQRWAVRQQCLFAIPATQRFPPGRNQRPGSRQQPRRTVPVSQRQLRPKLGEETHSGLTWGSAAERRRPPPAQHSHRASRWQASLTGSSRLERVRDTHAPTQFKFQRGSSGQPGGKNKN